MKLLIGAAIAASSLCLAPPAHADPQSEYLNYLHAEGFSSGKGDSGLINAGVAVCQDKAAGYSRANIAGKVMAGNPGLSQASATEIVDAAYLYLCPTTGRSSVSS